MKYVSFMTQNENKFNFLRFSTISFDFFKPEVPRNRLKPFFLNLKLKKGGFFHTIFPDQQNLIQMYIFLINQIPTFVLIATYLLNKVDFSTSKHPVALLK